MGRVLAFDVAKGVAIILVVVFHASQGLSAGGLLHYTFFTQMAENIAYSFHVQIFFLLTGYLAFQRANTVSYQVNRFVSVYYPYMLWSALTVVATSLGIGANGQRGLNDLLLLPFQPIYHFWFLLCLALATMILFFLRSQTTLAIGALVALCCACFGFNPLQIAYFFPFMALGAIASLRKITLKTQLSIALICAALLLITAYCATLYGFNVKSAWLFPVSLGACYLLLTISQWIVLRGWERQLVYVGERSLVIYLTHGFFATGARVFGVRILDDLHPVLLWVLCTGAGVFGPLVLEWLAVRLGLATVLGFRSIQLMKSVNSSGLAAGPQCLIQNYPD